jgi:uncharacterized protein
MSSRKVDLAALNQFYEEKHSNMAFIYGQDYLGKSEFIREFCKDKKYFYYAARHASTQEQILRMKEDIEQQFRVVVQDKSYDSCFSKIKSGNLTKLVVVIDDVDRILKKDPDFLKSIEKLLDRKLYPGTVMVLFCSSKVQWVEDELDLTMGKLRSRLTYIQKLEEAHFLDVVRTFPEYSVQESVEVYGVLGGYIDYFDQWDARRGLKFNVCKHILSEKGFLYRETQRILESELRELSVYYTILGAIAAGNNKLNDLFHYTGFSRPKISVYMKNLIAFDIIEKVNSFETGGWENAKKGVYRIRNTFVNFWFHFVYPHESELHMMVPESFYTKYIEHHLESYFERYFIKVCMEYIDLMNEVKQIPLDIVKMGTWVGKKGTIDIIAQNSIRESLIGKCSWSETSFTHEMYEKLLENAEMAKISGKYCYLFSATKFDSKLVELAATNKQLVLVDMNNL